MPQGRRPLVGVFDDHDLDRVAAALGIILGTESMLALTDGVGLSADDAKTVIAQRLPAARGCIVAVHSAPRLGSARTSCGRLGAL